jgi:hypothetical protein
MSVQSNFLLSIFFFFIVPGLIKAQTTISPDISVIPRFRLDTNDGERLPNKRELSRPVFNLEEFEIALQAYLNPYARADIFLTKAGFGGEPVEIEEAYATFLRGLPLDLNVRVGKYLVEFGKLNVLHPHAWPFITQPLHLQKFLGEFNEPGISVSYLLPTGDVYSRITVDLLKGTSIPSAAGISDTTSSQSYYSTSGRLMSFFPVGENSDLELGLSEYTGIHDPYYKYRFFYTNLDFKYKWRPSSYTSLTAQGEFLLNTRKITSAANPTVSENISTFGFYLYADYQFFKIFSVGARYDWTQTPYSRDDKAQAIAIFVGFYPVEETTAFRLQFQNTKDAAVNSLSVNSIALQFMFSMGPHKAHPF